MNKNTELLPRIARYLMLYGSFTPNIGLLGGKMGIVLFFYQYFRYTKNKTYKDFAGLLLDEVYKEINKETPLNFSGGLCGIGWAIEYLIRNNFVRANPDEALEELDQRIVEWDVRKITGFSLEKGLRGVAAYVIGRRQNRTGDNTFLSREYCNDLLFSLQKSTECKNETAILGQIINGKTAETPCSPMNEIIEKIKFNTATFFEKLRPIGIKKSGYTGIGLKMLREGEK
jgi:hypothetical protein